MQLKSNMHLENVLLPFFLTSFALSSIFYYLYLPLKVNDQKFQDCMRMDLNMYVCYVFACLWVLVCVFIINSKYRSTLNCFRFLNLLKSILT